MKKLILLGLAFLVALLVTELLVRYVLKFPTYGVEVKLSGIRSSEGGVESMFYPHSRYWTVEGGNRVFERNNLGLPGTDVVVADSSQYVFVLGCSFIEAEQVPPESIATSMLQRRLSLISPRLQVINLGHSGHDLYDSYLRAAYFERMLPPAAVILELHEDGAVWFPRHAHPLRFTVGPDFGRPVRSWTADALRLARNYSSLVNIVVNAVKADQRKRDEEEEIAGKRRTAAGTEEEPTLPADLLTCLEAFHEKYGEKFCLVSMLMYPRENQDLADYCKSHGMNFVSRDLIVTENRVAQAGHLNIKGNTALGELLYESYLKIRQKP